MIKEENIECAIAICINGDQAFRSFLLGYNLTVGANFSIEYGPRYAQLINLTVQNKVLSIRRDDFEKIEWVKIR